MNNQKQDQTRLQQQEQSKVIINNTQAYSNNSHNPHSLTGSAAPQQALLQQNQQQQQQQGQMFQNFQKNNKSFTSYLSGQNEFQQQQNQQQIQIMQQQAQLQQISQSSQAKPSQISAFSIKIIEGRLKKFANSVDLRPFVQVQFGKRLWRTQVNQGIYPKWNEEKRFEIYGNKMFDLNNPSAICSSSATTSTSCSSISPQPSSNQQMQIFQQQQMLNGQHGGVAQNTIDWNIEFVVLHKSQDEEVELGRTTILNVEEQQIQREEWFCIQNSNGVYGSVQIQFQFEYVNYQLQINKNSHQMFVNQKQQQKQQINNPQQGFYKRSEDIQSSRPIQSNVNSTSGSSLNQTPQLSQNKRNPSSHSETSSSFQDFQLIPQTTSRVASSIPQNYLDIQESVSKQSSFNSHYQGHSGNSMGYSFRQYDAADLVSKLQQENELLMKEDRKLQERINQVSIESTYLTKEQDKLDLLQKNIIAQEGFLRQKQQGLEDQKDEFKQKLIKLEESKKLLQSYIDDYQNLVSEEQEIMNCNQKLKSDIKMMNEEEPQVQDTLNTLQKQNNSEILQLKIFKLKMINHLKEINSIFYNRKPIIPKVVGYEKGYHHRAKSQSNHISFGVDTITDYSVALKNIQLKVNNLTEVINNKNYEIESLREQIHQIQSNYDDQ